MSWEDEDVREVEKPKCSPNEPLQGEKMTAPQGPEEQDFEDDMDFEDDDVEYDDEDEDEDEDEEDED